MDKPLPGDEGVEVDFFGEPVRIPAGAAYFAQRAGAPIVVAFAWRQADRSFAVTVLPPLQAEGSVQATMQRVMDVIGRQIEAHPEHWYMFRRMWPAASTKLPARLEEAVA